jgi:branched-chain amino acid transport system permease protein
VPLWPGVFIALLGGMVIALATGAVSMRVSGIPFAMVTLAFAQAGSVLVRRNSQITGGEEGLGLNTTRCRTSSSASSTRAISTG